MSPEFLMRWFAVRNKSLVATTCLVCTLSLMTGCENSLGRRIREKADFEQNVNRIKRAIIERLYENEPVDVIKVIRATPEAKAFHLELATESRLAVGSCVVLFATLSVEEQQKLHERTPLLVFIREHGTPTDNQLLVFVVIAGGQAYYRRFPKEKLEALFDCKSVAEVNAWHIRDVAEFRRRNFPNGQ